MKRLLSVYTSVLTAVLLLCSAMDTVFAQSLEVYTREACPGAYVSIDGGLYKKLTKTCEVISVLAEGTGPNLLGNPYVTPAGTTNYHITYRDNGVTETKQAKVVIIAPPTLKIQLTTNVSAGICEGESVEIKVLNHTEDVFWSTSFTTGSELENTKKTYTLTESCRIWAQSYNGCGFVDTSLNFVVKSKPVLEKISLELKPNLQGTFCAGCGFFPKINDILVMPDDISLSDLRITWKDGTTGEKSITSGTFSQEATIHAKVSETNSCGSVTGTIDTTFTLKFKGTDCAPETYTSVSAKPCEGREVRLENHHKGSCTITPKPSLTALAGSGKLDISELPYYEESEFERYRWTVLWDNYSPSDAIQKMHVNASYTVTCPYSAKSSFSGTYEEDIQVQPDTSYLSFKYEYCPDSKATLTIEGKENAITITNVESISPSGGFGNLFNALDVSKNHKKVYETKAAIGQSNVDDYAPLRLKVAFKVDEGNCHFTLTRTETVQLRPKGNCNMDLKLISSRPCIGESRTLRLSNAPDDMRVDRIELSEHPEFRFNVRSSAAGAEELVFSPYYAGAPALASKADSVEATVYYHMDGSAQTLSWTKRFFLEVEACPPYFQGRPTISANAGGAVIERNCPICPGFEFRGIVEFKNTTTDKGKTVVDFVSTARNTPTSLEKWDGLKYNLRRYLFGDMDYHISVRYNEGDSIYTIPALMEMLQAGTMEDTFSVYNQCNIYAGDSVSFSHFGMANICGLVKESTPDSVCQGETVHLYVYSQNLYDTLQGIEWNDLNVVPEGNGIEKYDYKYKNKSGKELTRQIDRFHYTVQAHAPGIYPFKITSKIRDSIIVRYDTVRIAVMDKPRIFVQDTVYACEHADIDLNDYVDKPILRSLDNPGALKVSDVVGFDKRIATGELRYHCSSGVKVTDTIFIKADGPVYNIFIPDTQLCPGNRVTLRAGTNGRITWIKRQQLQGGGFMQPDTLLVDGASDAVIYDTVGYTDCVYTVISRTACPKPPSSLVQFRAKVLEEPNVEIIDRSACRPDPLFLQTTPFDAAEVDSVNDVRWYVDGQLYSLPSVPPSASVHVVCVAKGLNGCQGSDTIEMKSYDAPALKVAAEGSALSGNPLCVNTGDQVSFSASGADAYDWFLTSRNASVSTADRYTLKVGGDDTVYVTGRENKVGCATIDTVFVYLKPLARVTNDTIGCNGDTLGLHPVEEQGVAYTWYNPDGNELCSCKAITFAPYEPSDTGVYKVKFIRKGCDVTKDVHLRMYPVPKFGFSNSIFCEDDLLSLDVRTGMDAQWNASSRFVWYGKDGNPLHDKVGQSAYEGSALSLSDAGIYHIEIYVDRCLNEDSVWVQVDPHSHPSFAVDSFYCEGATLSTKAVDQGEGSIYRWYSANRLPSEGVSNKIELEGLTMEDSTWLTLEIERGACVDDTSVFVHVRSLPIAKIVAQGSNSDGNSVYYCEGMPISLFVDGMRPGDAMSWYHHRVPQEGFSSDRYSIKESELADSGWYSFHVNRNGCTGKDSLYVDVRVVPIPLVNDTFMCSGITLVVDASNPLYPGSSFSWQPSGTTGPQLDITSGGTYTVRMSYEGCEGTKSFLVDERPTPQIEFPEELTICQRDSVVLTGPDGMEVYLWQDGSTAQSYVVKAEGLYTLYVELAGCSDYREATVSEDFCSNLYFPSAFTPNGDGHNDSFGPITTAEDDQVVYVLYIYNRNGEKVFESHSLKDSWDGTFKGEKCPAGIYVYQCKAHAKQNGRNLSEKGTVNLLR